MVKPDVRLWLDDVREAPVGWIHAKNIEAAKLELTNQRVVEMSLDHDLGNGPDGDGSRLIVWMAEHNVWPKKRPVSHSMNPVGKAYIEGVVKRYWPGNNKESSGQ